MMLTTAPMRKSPRLKLLHAIPNDLMLVRPLHRNKTHVHAALHSLACGLFVFPCVFSSQIDILVDSA
jgi:hypothetical protein